MISLNNEACCICGNTCSELAFETSYPEHGYPGSFQLRRCAGCELLFNSPRMDADELSKLYGRSYYFFNRSDAREFNRVVAMYRRSVALVEDGITDKRALDIGGGRGYLPAVLKQLGWSAKAIEISQIASEYARSKFGLDVFTGTIEQYAVAPEREAFPLVTAIDVIEHVPDPVAFIQAAASTVQPGGRLIIDTPNAAASNIRIEGITWQGFNPFHIYLFNPNNLTRLLEKAGLAVERKFTYGNARATRHSRSRTNRLGQLARSKLPAAILGPMARAWFATRGIASRNGMPQDNLARSAIAASDRGNYFDTPDAREELARDLTGDNVVLIARKA